MGRVWVLDTETKGTGAQMVPLETVQRRPQPSSEPFFVPPKPKPREPEPAEPRAPRRFKVTDVATRVVVADDATARETVQALQDVRSVVDVSVSVWEPDEERWRLLTLGEQRKLWELRSRVPAVVAPGALDRVGHKSAPVTKSMTNGAVSAQRRGVARRP